MNKEILIFQHSDIVTAGYLLDLLEKDEIILTTVRLDKKDKIPNNLEKFHAMICLGGEMNTNMEDAYPWILDEKEAIKNFVIEIRKPYLGICLGAQLLGEVLGGKIVRTKPPEIGILNIEMLATHLKDKVFRNLNLLVKDYQTVITKSLDDKVRLCRPTSTITLKFQVVFTILKVCRSRPKSGPNPDFEHFQGCNINKYWFLLTIISISGLFSLDFE